MRRTFSLSWAAPGSPKWVPGWCCREWGGGWSSRSSPRTGSPAFCGADHRRGRGGSRGRGRPCDLQRQVPAVPLLWRGGAPTSVQRQTGRVVFTVEIPQLQFLEKVVDVPVVQVVVGSSSSWTGLANSEGASDSVHRQSLWTFQFATETGTLSAWYGGGEGFYVLFWPFFALLQVVWR